MYALPPLAIILPVALLTCINCYRFPWIDSALGGSGWATGCCRAALGYLSGYRSWIAFYCTAADRDFVLENLLS